MSSGMTLFFGSLVLFQLKHFICDFVLQTAYIYRNKGIYGHPAGFLHAGLHAITSLPAILLLTRSGELIATLVLVELAIHYHVDWLKLYVDKRFNFTMDKSAYWMVFGADQLAHQLTYAAFLAVLADKIAL
jgi:hypothetical protein